MADVGAPSNYEVVVEPSRGWIQIPWREFWEYRDLLVLLVQRDFVSRYKQTILGPAWFVLQPVMTMIIFVIFFGKVAGISTDKIPGPLFYLCGLLAWSYFAQTITTGGATFVHNAHLFGKVYFPRLVVPVSIVVSNLIAFALQFVPFIAFFAYYKLFRAEGAALQPDWHLFLLPLPILHVAALALGVSLWMSALTAKYRDLVHLNQYLIQMWMFATPIIYPLSMVSEKLPWLRLLIWANPMSAPVESFRICLLGRGTLDFVPLAASIVVTLVLLVSGLILFHKVEGTVVDTV